MNLKPTSAFAQGALSRPGYSDRMAWLMAELALLAYFPFENKKLTEAEIEELKEKILKSIRKSTGERKDGPEGSELSDSDIERLIETVAKKHAFANRDQLSEKLSGLGFKLIEAHSISTETRDTQFFTALTTSEEGGPYTVVVFRGTEFSKWRDFKTDADAELVVLTEGGAKGSRVHKGFWGAAEEAAKVIREDLEPYKHLPRFFSGHSMGGAEAILSTYFLEQDGAGACYTFGAPRTCDERFGFEIKTPIYRLVHGYDGVPMLPPRLLIRVLNLIATAIPVVGTQIAEFIDNKLEGYVHLGDMRYLVHLSDTKDADDVRLTRPVSNPNQIFYLQKWFYAQFASRFKKAVGHHSMEGYRDQLRSIAINRNPKDTEKLIKVRGSN